MPKGISEATISFASHDQIRTLFGARDRYLRQVRDAVGIDVVLRGDELRLQGDEDRIQRGLEVFAELRDIIEKKGKLAEADVQRVLQDSDIRQNGEETPQTAHPSVDLFEQAKTIHPRSEGQAEYLRLMRNNDLVLCGGPAGTGKTYLAVAMAINALRTERVRKIVLARPAVEAGEKLGFLPGDMLAKVNPFLRPLLDALEDLLDFGQVQRYMENDIIEIVPLAFMRGRTLNNTFMILDEAQNTTVTQMKMFLTRMGAGSKVVVTGDTTQVDLPSRVTSGLLDSMQRLAAIEGVAVAWLSGRDIVRHRLVQDIVEAYDESARHEKPRKK